MKALVTGAGGEMGRLLVPELVARGIDVIALDLNALPQELEAQCFASARMNFLDTVGVGAPNHRVKMPFVAVDVSIGEQTDEVKRAARPASQVDIVPGCAVEDRLVFVRFVD